MGNDLLWNGRFGHAERTGTISDSALGKADRHAGGQSGTRNDRISARGRLYPAESGF